VKAHVDAHEFRVERSDVILDNPKLRFFIHVGVCIRLLGSPDRI
jgi:hypothetical protein